MMDLLAQLMPTFEETAIRVVANAAHDRFDEVRFNPAMSPDGRVVWDNSTEEVLDFVDAQKVIALKTRQPDGTLPDEEVNRLQAVSVAFGRSIAERVLAASGK